MTARVSWYSFLSVKVHDCALHLQVKRVLPGTKSTRLPRWKEMMANTRYTRFEILSYWSSMLTYTSFRITQQLYEISKQTVFACSCLRRSRNILRHWPWFEARFYFFFKLIRQHCFKHSDRIQPTNLRPGHKTTRFRYWIETSVKHKESLRCMEIEGSMRTPSGKLKD